MRSLWIPLLVSAGALAASRAALAHDSDLLRPTRVEEEKTEKLRVGSTVPETIELRDFEGRATSFKELRGKVVVLHFWSDRCPAERHANPIFKEMEGVYAKNEDVVMVGIASNQNELGPAPKDGEDYADHYKSLRKKRDEVGYRHTILADHGNKVSDLFQARTTPHCFVLDKDGVIRYAGALDDDPRGSKGDDATNFVVEAAAAVLKGEKPAVTETKPYG